MPQIIVVQNYEEPATVIESDERTPCFDHVPIHTCIIIMYFFSTTGISLCLTTNADSPSHGSSID